LRNVKKGPDEVKISLLQILRIVEIYEIHFLEDGAEDLLNALAVHKDIPPD